MVYREYHCAYKDNGKPTGSRAWGDFEATDRVRAAFAEVGLPHVARLGSQH